MTQTTVVAWVRGLVTWMPLPPPPSLQAPSDPFALTAVFGDLDAIRRQVLELQERLAASQAEAAAAKRLQAQVGPAAPCLPADPAWQPHAYPHANFPPLESFLACQTLLVTHFHMLTPPPFPPSSLAWRSWWRRAAAWQLPRWGQRRPWACRTWCASR